MKLNAISRKYFHYFVNWPCPYRKTTAVRVIAFIGLIAFIAFSCSGRIYATEISALLKLVKFCRSGFLTTIKNFEFNFNR